MITDNKDIKKTKKFIRLWTIITILGLLSFAWQAKAQDDGARSYWNASAGTNIFSFQYLPMNMGPQAQRLLRRVNTFIQTRTSALVSLWLPGLIT